MIKNKSVLITGGTGSLGRHFVDFILNDERHLPERIRIFSRDEDKQYWMAQRYKSKTHCSRLEFVLGDVREFSSVASALKDMDIVVHAAAMKQVPACEDFPHEAVKTNVVGAKNIVDAICQHKIPVERVVGISTDKACNPINVYGMTKAIQEKILLSANTRTTSTDFVLVRYGNVLGSRGSVIPLFKEQIKNGGPVTITDAEMTRFFFSLDDASSAVLAAASDARRGEILVPKIKAFNILNVAKAMIGDSGISMETVGIRPGEKKHETLMSSEEMSRAYLLVVGEKTYYSIRPFVQRPGGIDEDSTKPFMSNDDVNDLEETREMLKKNEFV